MRIWGLLDTPRGQVPQLLGFFRGTRLLGFFGAGLDHQPRFQNIIVHALGFYYKLMLNYLTSFGASSSFQKNRLIATSKTLDAPEEHILKKILKTFEGEDEETRAQIAFATIIKKIHSSESNSSWIYLVKNLIILDRVLDDLCFTEEIAELRLPIIEDYMEKNSQYLGLRTDEIVKNYWRLIKQASKVLKTKRNILYFPRSQRSEFLETLSIKQLLKQIEILQQFFRNSFSLINTLQSKQGLDSQAIKNFILLQKSKLIVYLKTQLLYKLISYYSCQMQCTNRFVVSIAKDPNMEMIQLQQLKVFKQTLLRFKANSNSIIEFVERNKEYKGFEVINYRDFDPMPGNELIKSIDKCILEKMNLAEESQNVQQFFSQVQLKLQARPTSDTNAEIPYQPRRKLEAARPQKQASTPFKNWKSSFSEDFPQKQIMTVDLIMELKKEQDNKTRDSIYDDIISYNDRETCVINDNESMPDHFLFRKPLLIDVGPESPNIYSGVQSFWNAG